MRRVLHDGLADAARRFGGRDFVRAGERSWSFADVERMSVAFAGHLASRGVSPGDRVALMSTNRVELVAAVHGISKVGAAAVMVSPAWKELEVAHALSLTAPVLGVADGAGVAALAEHVPVTDLDGDDAFTATGPPPAVEVADDAESVLVFSSGTTGLPKAVRHTHRSMAHAVQHWVDALGLGPDDRFQIATPPTHILGLLNVLTAAAAGATVRLHLRYDIDEALGRIESERMTLEMAVAPIALAMASHPRLEQFDLSSLRYILWGATPVTASVAEEVTRRTGVRWMQGYGASELPVISCNPVDRPELWRLDSPGLPVPGVELRVVDLDGGGVLPAGEVGEIQARSPSLMAGYLPDEANDDAFVEGGWYRTGDVGWLEPAGWVHLSDRSKEMIKVKGFQVAPAEIESVLLLHEAVLDCAVFGVPDEQAGELPVAAVQLDPARPVADGELEALVARSLATYKRLREVVLVDAVPRLPSGKALRRVLREQWRAEHGEASA